MDRGRGKARGGGWCGEAVLVADGARQQVDFLLSRLRDFRQNAL